MPKSIKRLPTDSFVPLEENGRRVHVAICDRKTITLILEGKKAIETRFSENRCAPFGKIAPEEVVLFKATSGPVLGMAKVCRVNFYANLDRATVLKLKENFNDRIQAPAEFWRKKSRARYATFLYLEDVRRVEPFSIEKHDRRGWVTFESSETYYSLDSDKHVCKKSIQSIQESFDFPKSID